jgi:hypothetical protein
MIEDGQNRITRLQPMSAGERLGDQDLSSIHLQGATRDNRNLVQSWRAAER